jgi:hypothetical protein
MIRDQLVSWSCVGNYLKWKATRAAVDKIIIRKFSLGEEEVPRRGVVLDKAAQEVPQAPVNSFGLPVSLGVESAGEL